MSEEKKRPILSDAKCYGNLYFLSGQMGKLPGTDDFAGDCIKCQTKQTALNIEAVLNKYGMGMENIIKANCYLTDMANYKAFNEVYAEYFISSPTRTCVAVKELPFGALCEIEVVALKDAD